MAPKLIHPCKAPISQRFGDEFSWQGKTNFYRETYGLTGHNGIDYAPPNPDEVWKVYAAADGVIEFAGWGQYWDSTVGGGSYTIVIRHPSLNLLTAYLHLTANSERFARGQAVKQGDQIAVTGNTGVGTGPHLHFQVMPLPFDRNRNWGCVDPAPYMFETINVASIEKDDSMSASEVKEIKSYIDKKFDEHRRYNNTTRTDRDSYALLVDGGLNATDAKRNTQTIIKQNEGIISLLAGLRSDLNPEEIVKAIQGIQVNVVVSQDEESK